MLDLGGMGHRCARGTWRGVASWGYPSQLPTGFWAWEMSLNAPAPSWQANVGNGPGALEAGGLEEIKWPGSTTGWGPRRPLGAVARGNTQQQQQQQMTAGGGGLGRDAERACGSGGTAAGAYECVQRVSTCVAAARAGTHPQGRAARHWRRLCSPFRLEKRPQCGRACAPYLSIYTRPPARPAGA